MQYNYSFEIAAAIMMLLLLFVNLFNQNLELAKSKFYFAFLVSCLIETFMNIASSIGLARTDLVSNGVNNILCFVFFVAEATTSILFFMYVLTICETKKNLRKLFTNIALVPFVLFIAMISTNNIFHLIYEMKDNVYSQGIFAAYGYYYIELFLACSVIIALKGKNTIRGRNRYSVLLAVFISLIGITIQYKFKNILLTGFSNTIVLYIFYIVIQNPNEQRDKVTNVYNNRAFYLRFENNVNQEKPMRILTVDIHQQTQLNALFGYKNGNIILSEVGRYLTGLVGNNNVFLISPDVFAVMIDNNSDVFYFKEKIFKRFDSKWELDNIETMVPVNISKIDYPEDVHSSSEFYGLHDYLNLVLRKNAMINYIEATPEIKNEFYRTSEVESALNKALENKTLEVYFQPVYDVRKNRFSSMEALARLFDKKLGSVAPDEFIETAESNGTIVPLDLLVLEKTCEFISKEILPYNDKLKINSVNVNISVQQCLQQNMDDMVISIIDKYKIPREMIVLEVTERAAVNVAELMEKHMNSLMEKGVRFALDDYGTGNSNCSYLIDYPFDKVKFDKNMIWSYFDTENGKIILDGEIDTIHKLNIPIVAEGIETEEQFEIIKEKGVEFIQGYYFSKPLDSNSIMKFLFDKIEQAK